MNSNIANPTRRRPEVKRCEAKFVPNNTAEFHVLTSHIMASFFFSLLTENTFDSNF